MRKLFIILLFLPLPLFGTDYYVKTGGSDAANGLTDGTAWATISKVNAVWSAGTFTPGDNIYFNRGDTFYGTLTVSEGGTLGNPITISAYGTGADPIITGFSTITGWSDEGGGIYSKTLTVESSPNMVTVNGVNTGIGRYPDSGWMTIDSHSTNVSITDAALPSSPDWDGAEVVIRKNHWIIDRNTITNHTGTTINYTSATSYNAINGYGYFIQNHLSTLTTLGEWYYGGGKFYMYFGGANPINYTVKVSTLDRCAEMLYIDYITFDNLDLQGANEDVISIQASAHITVQNCTIQFSGGYGINGMTNMETGYSGSENLVVSNNIISDIQNNGIGIEGEFNDAIITGNTISNVYTIAGMGGSLDGNGFAINCMNGSGHLIENNTMTNLGYVGVNFEGDDVVVNNNIVDTYCFVKDDGGGIYTVNSGWTGREITNNIISKGIGAADGTEGSSGAEGVYLDDNSTNVLVDGNIIFDVMLAGIYLHNAHENTITNNTVYDCDYAQIYIVNDGTAIRNTDISHNYFIAKDATQLCLAFASIADDITLFGTADYNYYARPVDDDDVITTQPNAWGGAVTTRTLSSWKSYTSQDVHSNKNLGNVVSSTDDIHFIYNATGTAKAYTLSQAMDDVANTSYSGTITLQPFTSLILLGEGSITEESSTTITLLKSNGKLLRHNGKIIKL